VYYIKIHQLRQISEKSRVSPLALYCGQPPIKRCCNCGKQANEDDSCENPTYKFYEAILDSKAKDEPLVS